MFIITFGEFLYGLCDGPIPRPEDSCRVYVCVCVLLSVFRCNNDPLPLQCVGRGDQTKREKFL